MKQSSIACGCVLALVLSAGAAFGQQYAATMVPALPSGFGSIGYGVNNQGVVVGQAGDVNGTAVAFVWEGGENSVALPMLEGGTEAAAYGINGSGVVVGFCRDAGGVSRAVKWQKVGGGDTWTITDLGTLREDDTGFGSAQRINDGGMIVGYSTRAEGGAYHATRWDAGGEPTDLGTLGYSGNLAYSQGLGINSNGDVSGYAYRVLGGPEHGMYRGLDDRDGTDITPPGQFGLAQWHNVTDDGQLGGFVSSPALTEGRFTPATHTTDGGIVLATLLDGLEGGYGYDINDDGVLVGTMFLLHEDPSQSIFMAFSFNGVETVNLNVQADGIVGTMTEARDISDTGLIVGTADGGLGLSQAVLLTPVGGSCAADIGSTGGVPGSDGVLDNNDFVVFIDWFFDNDPRADRGATGGVPGADGAWDNNDFVVFIDQFFGGCV